MTRKFPLIFTLSLGISFPLLLSVFGKGGFLHNQALRTEIERLRYSQQVLSLQVDSLQEQRELMGGRDALRDAAFKYGYQTEGEQVFYFENGGEDAALDIPITAPAPSGRLSFEGLSSLIVFFMALAFSSLLTVCYALLKRKRRKRSGLDG
ncbi:septum formation initiator family protein [Sphaerochaeta globosa]|uniref:Septum formation initiator n=1 Tax=Sphaerochaeta globosa (strain ATCC BAA-1886 / DSM 22777 / Buddy) TaxID=158189 RepID=F0RVW3_SPHGB|nr:septum formation initiator family protein [Sphaerochaeta globosa]ADY13175.1 Septum formation initiator [Sphaerochaeta globosa str. Buddy]